MNVIFDRSIRKHSALYVEDKRVKEEFEAGIIAEREYRLLTAGSKHADLDANS